MRVAFTVTLLVYRRDGIGHPKRVPSAVRGGQIRIQPYLDDELNISIVSVVVGGNAHAATAWACELLLFLCVLRALLPYLPAPPPIYNYHGTARATHVTCGTYDKARRSNRTTNSSPPTVTKLVNPTRLVWWDGFDCLA